MENTCGNCMNYMPKAVDESVGNCPYKGLEEPEEDFENPADASASDPACGRWDNDGQG